MDNIKNQYPEKAIGKAENLTGQKFGHWTVLYRTLNDSIGKAMWVCQCDCDNHTIKPVSARTLKNQTSTNCGCERLKTIANNADQKIHIRNEKGEIIQKKCFRCQQWLPLSQFWKNSAQKDGYCGECKNCQNTTKESRYNIYRKNARRRNIDFYLTKEEFYDLINQKCHYCGESEKLIGIDRIDSSKPYELSNCVPCCSVCNKMKLDYSTSFWIQHMKQIIEYYNKG